MNRPDPVVSPAADTIRRAREFLADRHVSHSPSIEDGLLSDLGDLAEALLAVGERDRAERDAAVREAGVWQRDRNVQVAALTEAGERDRRQIARLTEEFEEAARNWRAMARKERDEGWVASMCGEEGMPAHVLSISRALTFEYATHRLRAVLAGEEDAGNG